MAHQTSEKLDGRHPAGGDKRGRSGRPETDALDLRIIHELQREARLPFRQVARKIGVSTTTVSARASSLERRGVIKRYSAAVDADSLGYELTAVTEIIVSKGKLLEMEREIAKLPEVCAVHDVTGEIDGIVVAKFRDRDEMGRFTKGLLTMPFIERANTHLVLTTVKEDFRVPV